MEAGAIRRHAGATATARFDDDDKDPLFKGNSTAGANAEEAYEFEKIDFFIVITIVMAFAFEGSQQAKLDHRNLSIAWVVASLLECLLVIGYFAFAVLAGGSKNLYKKAFVIVHLPVLLYMMALLVWTIVEEAH
jgi:hypothetical protein